jgi:ligand-binding SRPBCC domain-containing protein
MGEQVPRFELETSIAAPPERCFDMALNVDTQLSLDPGMQAVAGVRRGSLHSGDSVTWRAIHFGVPWRMTSQIIVVERPGRFEDEMQRGPFAYWHHVHRFEPSSEGTLMRDTVHYRAPFGFMGQIFDGLVLHRYLVGLLEGRNRRLKALVERDVGRE